MSEETTNISADSTDETSILENASPLPINFVSPIVVNSRGSIIIDTSAEVTVRGTRNINLAIMVDVAEEQARAENIAANRGTMAIESSETQPTL